MSLLRVALTSWDGADKSLSMCGKIGVYIDMLPSFGGGFQYIEFVLDALQAFQNYDSCIVAFVLDDTWEEILRDNYPAISCCRIVRDSETIIETVNSSDCDYLIVPFCNDDSWIAAKFAIPFVIAIHDVMQFYFKRDFSRDIYGIHRNIHMHQRNLRRAIGALVDSELGREQLLDACGKIYKDKVFIQPFRAPNYLYNDTEERPPSLNSTKFIFYPATLTDHKNHTSILLAMEQLKQEGIIVNMVFTGEYSGFYEILKRLATKLGLIDQVKFIGYVSGAQMKWLYKNARAMIMPCYAGPTNIPPLEAMLMGCPIIISNKWSMPKQIGDAALYVNPEFHLSIASAIKKVWLDDDICKKLSQRGKKRAELFTRKKFNETFINNFNSIVSRYESEYKELHCFLRFCRADRLFVYGAGRYGSAIVHYLRLSNINIVGVVVSNKKNNPDELFGVRVMTLDEVGNKLDGANLVLALSDKYQSQVIDNLNDKLADNINYTIVTEDMINDMEVLCKYGMLD